MVLLVGALLIAALAAFMARSLVAGSATPQAGAAVVAPPPVDGPEILVATKALPVGTILDATALRFQPWPKDLVENAYFLRKNTDMKSLQGTVVRTAITAGQPITQGALVHPGDRGFLAAALGPGMRAVTVPISGASAVAGFVFPGDRVDLVLTQSVPGGGDGPPLKVSETVLRNLRVLATDQRTDNVDENGKTVVRTFSNVTVEATPQLAEKLAVVQQLGTLSLALRSIADTSHDLEEAIASGDVKVPDSNDPDADKKMMAKVAAMPMSGKSTFVTGGEVSRFQRTTVPGKPAETVAPQVLGGGSAPAGGSIGGTVVGPVVRVARGNNVTVVPVGGKN